MRLIKLDIKNFGSYHGEHSLSFSKDEKKNVTIIVGSGGTGKTTLFIAINWALYGTDFERSLKKHKDRDITDFVNESSIKEALSEKTTIETYCTLFFEHEGINYYITQLIETKPNTKGVEVKYKNTNLYTINKRGDSEQVTYHKLLLDQILPNNVRDYFLFDGDRIYDLASPGSSQEVRDAIYRVVDLELLSNARDHLEDIAKEYAREAKRESVGQLKEIEGLYNQEIENKDKEKHKLNDIKEEISSVKRQIKVLEQKLENIPDTSDLQDRRNKLESEIDKLSEFRKRELISLRKSAYISSLAFIGDDCTSLINVLNEKRNKGEIPRSVSKILLEDMIKMESCFICKKEIKQGNELYNAIIDRLETEKKRKSNEELLEYFFGMKDLSELIGDALNNSKNSDAEINKYDKNIKENNLEIEQIDIELKKFPQVDIVGITRELSKLRDEHVRQSVNENQCNDRILNIEKLINEYDKQRTELAKKQYKVLSAQLRENLARTASNEIDLIYDKFAEESRVAVEKLTIDEFKKFIISSSEYEVSLNSDYELEVLDSNGNRALQRLSMGQSQCLSLAFITAISRVSEKNPPLVIDMPFGRLDETVHEVISERLPELTSQLILFLLPNTEWNDKTKRNLKPKSEFVYELEFDSKKRETKIKTL